MLKKIPFISFNNHICLNQLMDYCHLLDITKLKKRKEKKRKTPSRLIQLLLVVNSYYFVNLFEMNMNYVFFHKWDVTTIGY